MKKQFHWTYESIVLKIFQLILFWLTFLINAELPTSQTLWFSKKVLFLGYLPLYDSSENHF